MNHREFLYGNKPFAFLPSDIHTGTNKNVKENKEKKKKRQRHEKKRRVQWYWLLRLITLYSTSCCLWLNSLTARSHPERNQEESLQKWSSSDITLLSCKLSTFHSFPPLLSLSLLSIKISSTALLGEQHLSQVLPPRLSDNWSTVQRASLSSSQLRLRSPGTGQAHSADWKLPNDSMESLQTVHSGQTWTFFVLLNKLNASFPLLKGFD